MVERTCHIEELVHDVLKLEPSQRESFLSGAALLTRACVPESKR